MELFFIFSKPKPLFSLPPPFTPPGFPARQSYPELYQAACPVPSASCLSAWETLLSTPFFLSFPRCSLFQRACKLYCASVVKMMVFHAGWRCTEVTCCFPSFAFGHDLVLLWVSICILERAFRRLHFISLSIRKFRYYHKWKTSFPYHILILKISTMRTLFKLSTGCCGLLKAQCPRPVLFLLRRED